MWAYPSFLFVKSRVATVLVAGALLALDVARVALLRLVAPATLGCDSCDFLSWINDFHRIP